MCCRRFDRRRSGRGFSLVELTVVLALLALIASLVTVKTRSVLIRGKQNAARTEIASIKQAVETYYSLYGRYPTNEEGLAALVQPGDKSPDGLLSQKPIDPWGHPYQYNAPGRNNEPYEVICFGTDGKEGGSGADQDLVSWDLKEQQP